MFRETGAGSEGGRDGGRVGSEEGGGKPKGAGEDGGGGGRNTRLHGVLVISVRTSHTKRSKF